MERDDIVALKNNDRDRRKENIVYSLRQRRRNGEKKRECVDAKRPRRTLGWPFSLLRTFVTCSFIIFPKEIGLLMKVLEVEGAGWKFQEVSLRKGGANHEDVRQWYFCIRHILRR